ncbi:hypothetical protein DP065_03165 [[Mycoplasma] anseris]|uniref:Uncharacterized protein n=1 Tax=[Mycoplasma] anseris TaxID=92400 RepID=A0A2Z4NDQ9_9BACT|nr:hypothetical protein DP065_03165 [[Mycoplasma] anseris]
MFSLSSGSGFGISGSGTGFSHFELIKGNVVITPVVQKESINNKVFYFFAFHFLSFYNTFLYL